MQGEQTDRWQIGKELDAYIEAELAALGRPPFEPKPRWSSNARAVCALIDELTSTILTAPPWHFTFTCNGDYFPDTWHCRIESAMGADDWYCEAKASTMALAFCRAFLQTKN